MKARSDTAANVMEAADFWTIAVFAAGDKARRADAINSHRKYLVSIGARGTPAQDFMAEVDNPCPDLMLRAMYRDRLLGEALTQAIVELPREALNLNCVLMARRGLQDLRKVSDILGYLKVDAEKIRPISPRLYELVNSAQ